MTSAIQPVQSCLGAASRTLIASKVWMLAKIIAQIAVRIFFVFASLVLAAGALPVEYYAIGLPIVALVSAFISSTFFAQSASKADDEPPSPKPLPADAPRGLENAGANCALNSVFQLLKGDPYIDQLLSSSEFEGGVAKAFSDFSKKYDAAQKTRRNVVHGSQALRVALHAAGSGISESASHQEDGADCLRTALGSILGKQQMKIKMMHYMDLDTGFKDKPANRPDKDYLEPPQPPCALFGVPLKQQNSKEPLNLQKMFDYACNRPENQDLPAVGNGGKPPEMIRIAGKDKKEERCEATRTVTEFTEGFPQGLYLHLLRWDGQGGKNDTAVEIPPQLNVKVAGADKVYQLASFVHHRGTPQGGHYKAGRVVNGKYYQANDSSVTLVDQAKWEKLAQQAYLLCYVLAPEKNP